ncbi:hypothetical protein VPH166E361_0083 [Vibrio phage 166E36-1]
METNFGKLKQKTTEVLRIYSNYTWCRNSN